MGRCTVRVFRTADDISDGQIETGTITLDDSGNLRVTGTAAKALDTLLDGVDRSDVKAVRKALQRASHVFDGAYVRASVEDTLGEDMNPYHKPAGNETGGQFASRPSLPLKEGNPYHEPAGSPDGGQFAHSPSAAEIFGVATPNNPFDKHFLDNLKSAADDSGMSYQDYQSLRVASGKWEQSLNDDSKALIDGWRSRDYSNVRNRFEGKKPLPRDVAFVDALKTAPKVNATVYRGIHTSSQQYDPNSTGNIIDRYQKLIGTTIEWKSPASTSLRRVGAQTFGNVMFEIKSKSSRFISHADEWAHEAEAIFLPNTRFKVHRVTRSKHEWAGPQEHWIIELEEV